MTVSPGVHSDSPSAACLRVRVSSRATLTLTPTLLRQDNLQVQPQPEFSRNRDLDPDRMTNLKFAGGQTSRKPQKAIEGSNSNYS